MPLSQQLSQSQHMALTPQLRMSIELLQLSSLQLQQIVQQNIESNPMLEAEEEEIEKINEVEESEQDNVLQELNFQERAESEPELPINTAWEDAHLSSSSKSSSDSLDATYFLQQETTLHDYISWQITLSHLTERDQEIANVIIDAIDDEGFLASSLEDVRAGLEFAADLDEIEYVLHYIQNLEPYGLGARDLSECLLLQLNHLSRKTPYLEQAKTIVRENLTELGKHQFTLLQKKHQLSAEQFTEILNLIKSLNPKPGLQIYTPETTYVVPDVIVRKINKQWRVELNHDSLPKLNINRYYASLCSESRDQTHQYLRQNLQEARWLIKSLEHRNKTLLQVATCIIQHQYDFLEYGDEALKPLVLREVADELGLNESTISRVTTQKFMATPQGIYELKHFFSNSLQAKSGQGCAAVAVRAYIKRLVVNEDAQKPLSDQEISRVLREQGVIVARRTVTKYRESMAIPAATQRRIA